ncbi:hypothetical protein BDV95DRAFT_593393 [Massariosphaeria phaeospora]|uniref:Uncharacterized protein n=1 Tax=Massariosphaeria phaeospora TaxID=100035 RepID=A0A7C8IBJ5_9PLEO|nr:hypothetical protein BDV95DRAFT_593393 [Massariosphaeria phaeospora]
MDGTILHPYYAMDAFEIDAEIGAKLDRVAEVVEKIYKGTRQIKKNTTESLAQSQSQSQSPNLDITVWNKKGGIVKLGGCELNVADRDVYLNIVNEDGRVEFAPLGGEKSWYKSGKLWGMATLGASLWWYRKELRVVGRGLLAGCRLAAERWEQRKTVEAGKATDKAKEVEKAKETNDEKQQANKTVKETTPAREQPKTPVRQQPNQSTQENIVSDRERAIRNSSAASANSSDPQTAHIIDTTPSSSSPSAAAINSSHPAAAHIDTTPSFSNPSAAATDSSHIWIVVDTTARIIDATPGSPAASATSSMASSFVFDTESAPNSPTSAAAFTTGYYAH